MDEQFCVWQDTFAESQKSPFMSSISSLIGEGSRTSTKPVFNRFPVVSESKLPGLINSHCLPLKKDHCTQGRYSFPISPPCWKRLKRLEDDGILIGKVALLDPEKIGLGLTAFVLIKTQHHSSEWYCRFVTVVTEMPEVLGFWRMAGEYDYLMRVQVADMKRYDEFYKRLVNSVPGLSDVTSSFAMEQIKYTTSLPIE